MNASPLDFNPFPEKEIIRLTYVERRLLFENAHAGDEEALNILAAAHGQMVESAVLQLQPLNTPANFTFTELFDTGISALKGVIVATEEKKLDEFVGWCVREGDLIQYNTISGTII